MGSISRRGTTLAATALALPLTLAASVTWADSSSSSGPLPLIDRAANGAVDEPGGAMRLDGDQTQMIRNSIRPNKAKNVILIVGDGMGDSEITVARNYLQGAGGAFAGLDALPLTGQMTTYSVNRETGLPDYDPDSAATGTAWSTGVKSYDGAIGVDRSGKPRDSLLDLAKASGRATGNVTTSEVQDATPAVQVASISDRDCKGPVETATTCPEADKAAGGAGSISEQLLETRPDVTFGGGAKYFEQVVTGGDYKGRTVRDEAKDRGFVLLDAPADLKSVDSADQNAPVLGLFSAGNLPVKFAPLLATPGGAAGAAQKCKPNPDFNAVPTLDAMTGKAIDLLSSSKAGKKNGFFLQVESASIDKRDHARDVCGQIGETEQVDRAIKEALDFASQRTDTMVIVTADHAHTSQIVDGPTGGNDIKLRTVEGADMIVAYNTSPGSQQHTGAQVRVAGYGPGAANVVGLIDQTDLFGTISRGMAAWGGKGDKAPRSN